MGAFVNIAAGWHLNWLRALELGEAVKLKIAGGVRGRLLREATRLDSISDGRPKAPPLAH